MFEIVTLDKLAFKRFRNLKKILERHLPKYKLPLKKIGKFAIFTQK